MDRPTAHNGVSCGTSFSSSGQLSARLADSSAEEIPVTYEVDIMAGTSAEDIIQEESTYGQTVGAENSELQGLALANAMLKKYFLDNVPGYERLQLLRAKANSEAEGTTYFQDTDTFPLPGGKKCTWPFYVVMREIADELHAKTRALMPPCLPWIPIKILDLCMAPGGYSAATLKLPVHSHAKVYGITLDPEKGGHEIMIDKTGLARRVNQIIFQDISMLAAECGMAEIPQDHPDAANFSMERPFPGHKFNLVFCDGVVLSTHQRLPYREEAENVRLLLAQMILGVSRLVTGGTIIIRMNDVDVWWSAFAICEFSTFSDIRLFKPRRHFADKGLFYLIAENVESTSPEADDVVDGWKEGWQTLTLGGENGSGDPEAVVEKEEVNELLQSFGPTLTELGKTVWTVQEEALNEKFYPKDEGNLVRESVPNPRGTMSARADSAARQIAAIKAKTAARVPASSSTSSLSSNEVISPPRSSTTTLVENLSDSPPLDSITGTPSTVASLIENLNLASSIPTESLIAVPTADLGANPVAIPIATPIAVGITRSPTRSRVSEESI